jgi:predicted dehydrogenase
VNEETFEIQGEGYTIHIDIWKGKLQIWDRGELAHSEEASMDTPSDARQGTRTETEAFLEAVRTGTWNVPTLQDALVSMRLVDAADAGEETDF